MPSQLFGTNSLGGFFTNNELSLQLRIKAQPLKRFRQFVQIKGAKGARRGNKVYFDKLQPVATAAATGGLAETATIPETNFSINQGTLTINEYANAIAFTNQLVALSELDVDNSVVQTLMNDMAITLDSVAGAQFQSSDLVYVASLSNSVNITTAGTASSTASSNLNGTNWRAICDDMRKKNIPFYDGQSYVVICSVGALSGFFNDTQTGGFVDVTKYSETLSEYLYRGEAGRYYMGRFVEETNVLKNLAGTSTTSGEAVAIGFDAVMEGVAIPEELREKVPTDYGRSQGIAWYALLGFQKIWNQQTDGSERIAHITSL
jgi:N4-gp56 family major capsid protein